MTQFEIIQDLMARTVKAVKDGEDEQVLVNIAVQAHNRLQGYSDDGEKGNPVLI